MKKDRTDEKKDVLNALYKKAMGYVASESVEEYSAEDKELKLCKKKVTKKHIPPDVSALKVLLSYCESAGADMGGMTDAELETEKRRLLKLLKEYEGNGLEEAGAENEP